VIHNFTLCSPMLLPEFPIRPVDGAYRSRGRTQYTFISS